VSPLPTRDLEEVFHQVGSHWEDLRGGRLLLTGCTGFFGAWMLESLLWAQDSLGLQAEILVLTRDAQRFRRRMPHLAAQPSLHLIQSDARTVPPLGDLSHIIHGAVSPRTDWELCPPEEMIDLMVGGTARILDLACRTGARRFLHLSSGAVYGPQPPSLDLMPETYCGSPNPLDPAASYGIGKRTAEHLCALAFMRRNLPCVSARCFAFLAPHLPMDAHFAAGNFLQEGLGRRTLQITGDGTPIRSYLYGTDLAAWLWTLLIAGQPGQAYNVGSERTVSIEGLARAVAAQTEVGVQVAQRPRPDLLPVRYVPCTALARETLGLRETVGLEEAITRTLKWLSP